MTKKVAMISSLANLTEENFKKYYVPKIDEHVAKGYSFIIGGAEGTDTMAQKYLARFPDVEVTVYDMGTQENVHCSRFKHINGFSTYHERDVAMTEASSVDIVVLQSATSRASGNLYRRKYGDAVSLELVKLIKEFSIPSDQITIVPIGLQCSIASYKKEINKTSHTFPFDWMFATPQFVYQMLELLLDKNMDLRELVEKHFFFCEKRVNMYGWEHYRTTDKGASLYNAKYNAIFPHEHDSQSKTINKYVRRFERLKDLILNQSDQICFIYISQSSLKSGNFTIDGMDVIHDVYYYLSKIYTLIGKFNSNYKVIAFDAIKQEDKTLLNKNVTLYELNPGDHFGHLLQQVRNITNIFGDSGADTSTSTSTSTSPLEIIEASYWTPKTSLDITDELRKKVVNNRLEIVVSNEIKGDPEYGALKYLTINYKQGGSVIKKVFKEYDRIII